MMKRKINPKDLRKCWKLHSKSSEQSNKLDEESKESSNWLSEHNFYSWEIWVLVPLSPNTSFKINELITSNELASYEIIDSKIIPFNDLSSKLIINTKFTPLSKGIFKILGCVIQINVPNTKTSNSSQRCTYLLNIVEIFSETFIITD